jgi:hypothetical protein
MSAIDAIVDAVSFNPHESEITHREARAKARAAARPGDWLSIILKHHEDIEAAFASVKSAPTVAAQSTAQQHLAILLTGHANAEESIVYPALTRANQKEAATMAYAEQATAKKELADLETLVPQTAQYLERLGLIRDAVTHHMYEEEGTWFLDLIANASPQEQAMIARRYQEEFDRYVGRGATLDYPPASQSSLAGSG